MKKINSVFAPKKYSQNYLKVEDLIEPISKKERYPGKINKNGMLELQNREDINYTSSRQYK